MACDVLKQYSKNDYFDIYAEILLAEDDPILLSDVFESLHQTYERSVADAIQSAIENGTFNENWDMQPGILPSPVDSQFNMNGAKNSETIGDPLSEYYLNKQNGYVRLSNMTERFFEDVISKTLFNKTTGAFYRPTTESVNNALYNYKVELLNKLWNFTGKSYNDELVADEDNLTGVIAKTISDFANLSNTSEADALWDDYIILKQFDKLIDEYTPFIKKNSAYSNTNYQGRNMYVWDPSGTYRQNWTDSEDSDIVNVTSPLTRMLADYFTCADANGNEINKPIGFTTFNIAMSTLATWLHENRGLNINVSEINKDIRKNGINADFAKAIDVYIETAKPNDSLKEVLWGIKKHIFRKNNAIPATIRNAFANQFFLTAKYSYMAYRQNYDKGDHKINGQYLEDSFINIKTASLMRILQNKVWFYQWKPELFSSLKNKHGITTFIKDGIVTIKFDANHWGKEFEMYVSDNGESIVIKDNLEEGSQIEPKALINLIQDTFDTLIPSDYENVLIALSGSASVPATLFNTFSRPIAILLAASTEDKDFASIFKYNEETGLLKTYPFQQNFVQSGKFQSIVDGINDLNVLKNGEGNNLPIYQLSPAIFDVFTLIDELVDAPKNNPSEKAKGSITLESTISNELGNWFASKEIANVFGNNVFVSNNELLKKIIVRSDVKIGNVTKSSDKLTVSEVASLAIFNDFYQNLVREPDPYNNDTLSGDILLQPITYSDKKTHFLPAIDLSKITLKYGDEYRTALRIFRDFVNPGTDNKDRQKNRKAIEDKISETRRDKTARQIWNQYLRFANVFLNNDSYNGIEFVNTNGQVVNNPKVLIVNGAQTQQINNFDKFDPIIGFNFISKIISNLNSFQNPLSIIRQMFKNSGTLLNEDFDIITLKNNKLQANESLYFNVNTYSNPQNFINYLTREKLKFAFDLQEYGISMDTLTHPDLKAYVNQFGTDLKRLWYDPHSGIMRLFRIFEKQNDGKLKEIYPTQADFESNEFKHRTDLSVQLNPMLEGFFYANALFGNQFNDILFGGTEGYVPKFTNSNEFTNPEDSVISQMMASRLANEFKRTTYGGAIKRKFAQGLQFGVSPKIRFAVVEDDEPNITTLRGETDGQVAQDGSGWVNPLLGRMIQKSLIDSPVGDVRKTIAGWVDPRTGTQVHFKWAETTITAYLRQKAQNDGSAEVMYRKSMQAFNVANKFKKLTNLEKYYNPSENAGSYVVDDNIITRTKPLYRYDLDSGEYWKLEAIRNTVNGFQTAWTKVDKYGTPVIENGKHVHNAPTVSINTLYDLDQALGGAFVFELDENNDMVPSEGVHDIIYNIVCMNDMKDDFIGYIVNHSACKAGAVNMNDYNALNNDNNPLNHHYLSSFGIGVQMDADHEMDFASVTEMSQMISLLTQSGTNIDTVNAAYTDIGKVAAEAMRDMLAVVNTEDEGVYRIIGKALLDTFDSSTKKELGLAQAFIKNAQNAILRERGLDNIILPYSAESVKGSFISAITALINKKGIKRKYSGFGGVQVPADKTMQHYRYISDGKELIVDYIGLRDRIRPILKQLGITWEQASNDVVINGQLNPFLVNVDPKSVRFEDTVVYVNSLTNEISKPIKLNTQKEFDFIRNLLDYPLYQVYVWTTKPRELAQSDIRLDTGLGELSEYDIDAVRASFYLDDIINIVKGKTSIDDDPFIDRKIRVIQSVIEDQDLIDKTGAQIAKVTDILSFTPDLLQNLKKICVYKAQQYFNEVSNIIKSEMPGQLPIQMSQIGDDLNLRGELNLDGSFTSYTTTVNHNINNIISQVVIGRRNFKKFGIRRGDKLADIKEQGSKFFYNRLLEQTGQIEKVKHQIKGTRYDAIMQLSNNENLLVLIGDQSDNLQHFTRNDDFVVSDNAVSYKGQVLFDNNKLKGLAKVSDFNYLGYVNDTTGELMPVIMVPDYDVFDRISESDVVINKIYNYNHVNWLNTLKHEYASHIDENDVIIDNFTVQPNTLLVPGFKLSEIRSTDNLLDTLNKNEFQINKNKLQRKAEALYRNFIQQLNYIQTRIPSQAMQSTSNVEVIDFADIDTNYIWVPKMIFKLQGSDLDIDKAYCMGYDVNDSGEIYALSNLIKNPRYAVDDILTLSSPTGGTVLYNQTADINVDLTESIKTAIDSEEGATNRIKALKAILSVFEVYPGQTVNITVDVNQLFNGLLPEQSAQLESIIQEVVKDANIHEHSHRSESEKEHALRNQVLARARKIMNNPASQLDAYTPIAMKEPRNAALLNTALGSKEKEMTLDNPMSIFLMQMQNMSGKQVIALTATGIKSYFIITTYFNTLVKGIENDLKDYINTGNIEKMNNIVAALNEITFDGKLNDGTEPYLHTFANINFYEIRKLINSNKALRERLKTVQYSNDVVPTKANSAFSKYALNGVINLTKIIEDLDDIANGHYWERNSNGTYNYHVVNAPDSLSALLSAATDNAKELILDKLNATAKFADIYITLLSHGVPFIKIAQMMTNNAFRIVAKYAQSNIFDSNTNRFNVQNAIDFVLNEKSLPNISRGLFEKYLTDHYGYTNEHKHQGFLYKLIHDGKTATDGTTVNSVAEIIYNGFLAETKLTETELIEQLKKRNLMVEINPNSASLLTAVMETDSNTWRNAIAKVILNLFNKDNRVLVENNESLSDYFKHTLISNLRDGLEKYAVASIIPTNNDQQLDVNDIDIDPIEAMFDMDESEWESDVENTAQRQTFWFKGNIRRNELQKLYRYAIQYFIPKTELWNSLDSESQIKARSDFEQLRSQILYATKEMKMLGGLGSINQGIRGKDFDEYHFVKNIESFINSAYINRGDGQITEEFNLFNFLTDPKYRDKHIGYYDKVKSAINILKAIETTANFKEMFSYIAVNRKMIERSAAVKLERKLADELLRLSNKTESEINRGTTKSLNDTEFKTLSRFVRDSIVYNFFRNLGQNLKFEVPAGQGFYDPTGTSTAEPEFRDKQRRTRLLSLSNIHNIATFKHLMDWYIIPKLQMDERFQNNAFIRNLSRDRIKDQKTGKAIVSFKINVPLINIDSSPKVKQMYSDVLTDFNKLLYMPIDSDDASQQYNIGNWTIGNLFFIYNLIVNKDRIGGNTMTRLFEDLISSGNTYSLPYTYYKYMSDIDTGRLNIFNDDGSINQDVFTINMCDLKYRLAEVADAEDKFGIEKSGDLIKISNTDGTTEDIIPESNSQMLSDYILELPFATKLVKNLQGRTHSKYSTQFNSEDNILADSSTVFNVMTEELAETYGKDIPMEIITDEEIDSEFNDRTDEERDAMKNSTGFIVNGNIYINGSKNSLDAPMHEIMHFIAAAMKFNKDPRIKSDYYKLLDWVTNWLDGRVRSGSKDDAELKKILLDKNGQYGNRHMSDIKEEILVTLLAREFKSQFYNTWGDSRIISPQMVQANIKQVLSEILNTDKVKDLDFNELGNATLSSVLKKFASQILSTDSTLLYMSINQNQEMADLKDLLIKGGFIELSEDCL